eukprot:GFUD01105470.1.p1 GENE.GFUD01105470.1~~GFUD01105470.1.p1  ORF type:complete len:191 (-),score=45.22 GFUD01105470.1:110-661(-)
METLRKISILAVVKLGIPEAELPQTVAEEVEILGERITSEWTGIFGGCALWYDRIKIDWSGGVWRFTPQMRTGYRVEWSAPQTLFVLPAIKIKAGRTNYLGYPGGNLFLLPGRKIWIDDYKIVVGDRKVIFYGACSSTKIGTRTQFRATLSLSGNGNILLLESKVLVENGPIQDDDERLKLNT